jgi:hypothetical protein
MSSEQRNDVWRTSYPNAGSRQQRGRESQILEAIRRLTLGFLNRDRAQKTTGQRQGSQRGPVWLTVAGVIGCPTCGALYIAEANADGDMTELEDQELEAIDHLAEECPSHRDYFLVGI